MISPRDILIIFFVISSPIQILCNHLDSELPSDVIDNSRISTGSDSKEHGPSNHEGVWSASNYLWIPSANKNPKHQNVEIVCCRFGIFFVANFLSKRDLIACYYDGIFCLIRSNLIATNEKLIGTWKRVWSLHSSHFHSLLSSQLKILRHIGKNRP